MGASESKQEVLKQINEQQQKRLSVISLNYSGILLSPFEFFSGESQEMTKIQTNLSNIYKKLLKEFSEQFNQDKKINTFKWSLGKIDQKMQEQRYSPLYNKNVGINKQNRLMGEDEFKEEWQKVFNQNIKAFKQKEPGFKYTQEEMKQAKDFDLLCYKTILSHVYPNLKSFQTKFVQGLNVEKYKQFMDKMFGKCFLNEEKKLEKTFNAMRNEKIDVVFVQEANKALINRVNEQKEYKVYAKEDSESIIIVRAERFQDLCAANRIPMEPLLAIRKELSWNNDTQVAFVDNFVLISGHLSSKKQKNSQQVYQMMQSLKKLHTDHPTLHIIVGCDANNFVPAAFEKYCQTNNIICPECKQSYKDSKQAFQKQANQNLKERNECSCYKYSDFKIYPNDQKQYTTSKKRTYLQPQVNKAEEVAEVCRDHLIIFKDDDMSNQQVCTILKKSQKEVFNLPCQEHPYDHFVVKAVITVNEMIKLEEVEKKQQEKEKKQPIILP